MSAQENGGSAFPHEDTSPPRAHGMTLRDYFAAKAMQGCFSYWAHVHERGAVIGDPKKEAIAELAYEYADAMLKERAK